jgi:hypothetical protein
LVESIAYWLIGCRWSRGSHGTQGIELLKCVGIIRKQLISNVLIQGPIPGIRISISLIKNIVNQFWFYVVSFSSFFQTFPHHDEFFFGPLVDVIFVFHNVKANTPIIIDVVQNTLSSIFDVIGMITIS